jgi:hypothetical protein
MPNKTLLLIAIFAISGAIAVGASPAWMNEENWRNNQYGLDHFVPPPWTAVTTAPDRLSCWGRNYFFQKGPFPSQIENQQHDILTAPMRLTAVKNGKELETKWNKQGLELVSSYPDEADFIQTGTLDGIGITVSGKFSFEGSIEYTVTLAPRTPVTMEQLSLQIPLRSDIVKFYHYQSWPPTIWHKDHIHYSKEQVGIVGNQYTSPFRWQIWFGDEDQSFLFFANSPRGWLQYREDRAFEIIRSGDTALLKINFADSDKSFSPQATSFKFALNVTPVKPLPKNWRQWVLMSDEAICAEWLAADADGVTRPNPKLCDDTGASVLGGQTTAERASLLGFNVMGMHWTTRYPVWGCITWGNPIPAEPEKLKPYVAERRRKNIWTMIYQDTNVSGYPIKPIMDHFEDVSRSAKPNPFANGSFLGRHWNPFGTEGHVVLCSASRTRRDWMIYSAVEALSTYPWLGLYHDESDPFSCKNPAHNHKFTTVTGREIEERDVFNMVEQWRRIYKEVKKRNPDAILLTDHNSPCYPFFDAMLMGEGEQTAFGLRTAKAYRNYYTPEDFRFRYAAKQWGMIPIFLPGGVADTPKLPGIRHMERAYNRELIAWTLIHDMTFWPVHCNPSYYFPVLTVLAQLPFWEARFYPYWNQQAITSDLPDKVKISYYQHGDRVLAVFANISDNPVTAMIKIDRKLLFPDAMALGAGDAETYRPIHFSAMQGSVYDGNIKIDAGDFRLCWFLTR